MNDSSAGNDAGEPAGRCDNVRRRLADIYDTCAEGLFRYAAMILADPVAAQDAVHQAFAKLAAMGGHLEKIEAMNAYLYRAVRNECYRLAKQRPQQEFPATALLEVASAEQTDSSEELRLAMEKALRSLSPEQREVVHMKVYEKLTFQQIARKLSLSINTIASRYRYALSRLRELLGPYGEL